MTTTPADILKMLGHEQPPIEWRTSGEDPVPVEKFGKDHYSTLAYVEVRAVDHKGVIDHDHMRTWGTRHPVMLMAKRRGIVFGTDMADASGKYRTRLKGGEEIDHDDYDCLDDMVAAGWLTVTMPEPHKNGKVFVDPWGKAVTVDGGHAIDPGFVTGMDELWLCVKAKWGLTEEGRRVLGALRAHKEAGGTFGNFEVPDA